MTKNKVTYCESCGDGWSDENFLLGVCCHQPLKSRLETDEEERSREKATAIIIKRAEGLNW